MMSRLVMHLIRFFTKHNISIGPQCCGSLLIALIEIFFETITFTFLHPYSK